MMKINISLFNHISSLTNDSRSVADQVNFLREFLETRGFPYTVSYLLDPLALNILIENFNVDSSTAIRRFCKRFNKMIVVVMTEHLQRGESGLMYGSYQGNEPGYISNIEERIYSLMGISEYIVGYVTLGELPVLSDFEKIMSVHNIYRIPYPMVKPTSRDQKGFQSHVDLSFTGFLTKYRYKVLKSLGKRYVVRYFDIVGDESQRERNLLSGKVSLNIPQRVDWVWVSPMRVLYCLGKGVPCVHIGTGDGTIFYKDVLSWVTVENALDSPDDVLKEQISACNNIVLNCNKFVSLLSVWEMMEDQ